MKKLIFLAILTLSADVFGSAAAADSARAEAVVFYGSAAAAKPDVGEASAGRSTIRYPAVLPPLPHTETGPRDPESVAPKPGTYPSGGSAAGAGAPTTAAMPVVDESEIPPEAAAIYYSAPKDSTGKRLLTAAQESRIKEIIYERWLKARIVPDLKASLSAAPSKFTTAEKEFDYFEDVLTSAYIGYELGRGSIKEDQANEIGGNFVTRRSEIIRFLLRNADGLKLDNLVAFDMGVVAKGILDRALARDKKKLQVVDLSGSEVGKRGFDTLFSALVNRGICDQRAKGKDGENWLEGIKVLLPKPGGKGVYPEDELELSKEYGIIFMPGKSLKLTS